MQPHLDKALENPKVRIAWESLDRSPGLLIVAGRSVPGMRFAVNASMGLSEIPYRRFLAWSVLSGVLWSVYTCALAYNAATTLSPFRSRRSSGAHASARADRIRAWAKGASQSAAHVGRGPVPRGGT